MLLIPWNRCIFLAWTSPPSHRFPDGDTFGSTRVHACSGFATAQLPPDHRRDPLSPARPPGPAAELCVARPRPRPRLSGAAQVPRFLDAQSRRQASLGADRSHRTDQAAAAALRRRADRPLKAGPRASVLPPNPAPPPPATPPLPPPPP